MIRSLVAIVGLLVVLWIIFGWHKRKIEELPVNSMEVGSIELGEVESTKPVTYQVPESRRQRRLRGEFPQTRSDR